MEERRLVGGDIPNGGEAFGHRRTFGRNIGHPRNNNAVAEAVPAAVGKNGLVGRTGEHLAFLCKRPVVFPVLDLVKVTSPEHVPAVAQIIRRREIRMDVGLRFGGNRSRYKTVAVGKIVPHSKSLLLQVVDAADLRRLVPGRFQRRKKKSR